VHHRIYKLLRLGVNFLPDWPLEIMGIFAEVGKEAETGSSKCKLSPGSFSGDEPPALTLPKRGVARMGRIRSWVKRVEHAARGNLASFELLDGSRYYFNPASWELFMHWHACLGESSAHNWPEAPEVIRKVCEAKDPQGALDAVMGQGTWGTLVYDPEILVNEHRLEPRGLVSHYDPQSGEHHIWDPYDAPLEDLSEP
jgi:hypothetical protein